ncbi:MULTISPECIES: WYL domain-containing protein [unclassified Methylobacterium]|uniref:helix-turn-helix transcriptional regulator n=1 Tax=unclassified Methylobacterium TaxID=2615210 RepID=UPI00068AAF1E|nr:MULTISPECIES: WYL domain-containing protein [unclassified Methylobacterium]SFU97858.1 WYL domain-containing protein [Methylobacterium sp. UNCCL125]
MLDSTYDMPPPMLTPDEVEAAALGAQWVAERGAPVLAGAARDPIAKISAAVPERLRALVLEASVGAPPLRDVATDRLDLARTRLWIRHSRKIRISYRDEDARQSERTIWSILIGYAERVRLLAAWCELRGGFWHFRTDRIVAAGFLDDPHGCRANDLRARWRRHMEVERGIRLP